MLDNAKVSFAANNSFGTSTHETSSESLIALTGNPYTDLAAYDIDLQGCAIYHKPNPNANGHTVTGRFNISGRIITAGATGYAELIRFLINKHSEHQQYVAACRERKRLRNMISYINYHPDTIVFPAWLSY